MTHLEQHLKIILQQAGYTVKPWKEKIEIDTPCTIYEQLPVSRQNAKPFYADFALPYARIDIEVDGKYWHSKDKVRDKLRDMEMRQMGWKIIRLTESTAARINADYLQKCIWQLLDV